MTAGKNKEVTKLINADDINTTVFFERVEGHTNYNWNIWENEREQQNPPTFLSHLVAINHESQWPKGMVFKRLCLSASLFFFSSGILNPLVFRRKRSGRNPRIFVVFLFLQSQRDLCNTGYPGYSCGFFKCVLILIVDISPNYFRIKLLCWRRRRYS